MLFALTLGAVFSGGGEDAMKIYFLLSIMSVFVGLSYVPRRSEAKKAVPQRPIRYQPDA